MTRQIDRPALRRFFLGVMGWPPRTVWQEATLEELADAYDGFMDYHGHTRNISPPGTDFLKEMMRQFPDTEKTNDNT